MTPAAKSTSTDSLFASRVPEKKLPSFNKKNVVKAKVDTAVPAAPAAPAPVAKAALDPFAQAMAHLKGRTVPADGDVQMATPTEVDPKTGKPKKRVRWPEKLENIKLVEPIVYTDEDGNVRSKLAVASSRPI